MPLPPYEGLEIESEERAWSGRFALDLIRFRHQRFDGARSDLKTWELWRRGAAAAVLPYDPQRDVVVMIEQFRLPALAAGLDPVLVELPAGLCDPGEAPEVTARREMREEMGLDVAALHPVGQFLLTPGGADEVCSLYAGRVQAPEADAHGVAGYWGMANESEDIRVRVWPADHAIELALQGRFPNSVTMIGLLWLSARRTWLRQEWSND